MTINPSSFLDEMFWLFDCLQLGVESINFFNSSFASCANIFVSFLKVLNQTHKLEQHNCLGSLATPFDCSLPIASFCILLYNSLKSLSVLLTFFVSQNISVVVLLPSVLDNSMLRGKTFLLAIPCPKCPAFTCFIIRDKVIFLFFSFIF